MSATKWCAKWGLGAASAWPNSAKRPGLYLARGGGRQPGPRSLFGDSLLLSLLVRRETFALAAPSLFLALPGQLRAHPGGEGLHAVDGGELHGPGAASHRRA